jgi:DNA (cytosine-5)-methyltransferase 1
MGAAKRKLLDLFAGCGGLSLGFESAGFEVVAGFDGWLEAVQVYNANFEHQAFHLDLSDVDRAAATISEWSLGVDGIIGGPPCQDFSSAGRRVESDRADLTEKFAWIVADIRPKFFVMENVERADRSMALARAIEVFETYGYHVARMVLDASRCGVPQFRKRLFTVGFVGEGLVTDVMRRLTSGLAQEPMTLRDYFGDSLGLEHYYRHPRSYERRGVFSIDEPSPTVRGVNRPVPTGYPGHPGDTAPVTAQLRPLTTAERAMVQTFPAGFQFPVSRTLAEQMIGNAVPVLLAQVVMSSVARHLELDSAKESPRRADRDRLLRAVS